MTLTKFKLPIAITPGEPAGIGPDIVLKLGQTEIGYPVVIIADPEVLESRASLLNLPIKIHLVDHIQNSPLQPAQTLNVFPVKLVNPVLPKVLDSANSAYVLETLNAGAHACLGKHCAALLTGPVHKGIINQAGFKFSGHTHYFAELTKTSEIVMLLATDILRIALVTDHIPLQTVSAKITKKRLEAVLRILYQSLQQQFGIYKPCISVCGLNPHAGEGGYLGKEEQLVIEPILKKLKLEGMDILGPLSADTAFVHSKLANTDAIVCMYHDQGLPVLKSTGFGQAINITLGLPFLRTSVDHGTALDLAGTGKADPSSLFYTLSTTIKLIHA